MSERAAAILKALVAELERQGEEDSAYLDLDDTDRTVIDGHFDLDKVAAAIDAALPSGTGHG